jgi:hypothetical protein
MDVLADSTEADYGNVFNGSTPYPAGNLETPGLRTDETTIPGTSQSNTGKLKCPELCRTLELYIGLVHFLTFIYRPWCVLALGV